MHNRFGVRPRHKFVPTRQQLIAKRRVIVDLAIEQHPHASIFIGHWLVAARQIDDAQPTMTKPYPRPGKNTAIIGTAMNHGLIHALNELGGDVRLPSVFENATDSAHKCPNRLSKRRDAARIRHTGRGSFGA